MKHIRILFVLLILNLSGQLALAQNVDCTRTTTLHDGEYVMEGTVFLERFEDGSLQLRFGDDFKTQSGPDVQVFLSNDSTSIAGAVMIADIGPGDGINHFEGALTLDVPSGIDINDYPYLIFRCVLFRAYWGGGTWSEATCGGGNNGGGEPIDSMVMTTCIESIVATTNWVSEVTVCPNDGQPDNIPLLNTERISAGSTYAYIFANDNNEITRVHFEDSYNFEGSSLETENIFGVSYQGTLNYNIGDQINTIMADTCAILSSTTTFLKVLKDNCGASFGCLETATATTNWVTSINICPSDGAADEVPFLNNEFVDPSEGHYAYIITDTLDNIMVVLTTSSFDFEGSGSQTQRVYGVSYGENLSAVVGQNISTITADDCAILSNTESLFLTVRKTACTVDPGNDLNITGKITAPNRGGISGVSVTLDNGMSTVTNADGVYNFQDLSAGTYTVTPTFTSGSGNGLSSTDLVLTARHILGLTRFDNVYQILSADANNNSSVSAVDLVQMRLVILGRSDSFAGNSSWRFLDIPDNLTGTDLPQNMSGFRTITLQDNDMTNANFTGIKVGDLNGSASLNLK